MATSKKITLIRHGNTAKAPNDFDRQLTEKGVQQALVRQESLSQEFNLVLSSAAPRAMDTAAIIAAVGVHDVMALDELYMSADSADRVAIDDMRAELAYASLRAYRAADTTDALVRYGETGAVAIFEAIDIDNIDNVNVLVVGHAVLLNAIAASLIGRDTDLILDANLDEAEGILVTIGDDGETQVELIQ